MSQPSVTAYFNTRKRQANEDILSKSKVLLLDQEHMKMTEESEMKVKTQNSQSLKLVSEKKEEIMVMSPKIILISGINNLNNFTSSKVNSVINPTKIDTKLSIQKTNKASTRSRSAQVCKLNQDRQTDIRESFLKKSNDADIKKESVKKVLFEKKGTLSPKKQPLMPKKNIAEDKQTAVNEQNESTSVIFTTPKKKLTRNDSIRKDLDLNEIKDRINKSGRLAKLKASIDRITKCDQRLNEVQKRNDLNKPQIQKFEQIQLEIPVSPQKNLKSPCKALMSPKKELLAQTSPQRRILFEPKESISPVKSKPDKTEAYQKYLSLAESDKPRLQLPYNYRLLAEIFRYIDTVSAMLFNRKELITFKKLKPAVQELLRRNVTLEHLAQIKTIYPDAYNFHQEKVKSFGSTSKQDKYELILTPNLQVKNDSNERNGDNVLQTATDVSMSPAILLQRKRKFYEILLDKVKAEHEQFLLKLDKPMVIPKEKIIRWHPEFNVDGCKPIEQSALPQPPNVEKATSAKHVLEKAKSLFHCNTRMEKALQRLAEAKMTSKSVSTDISSTEKPNDDTIEQVNITIVDSPSVTPTIEKSYLATAFKGIPNSLLEKVRAKQAAKALETMTRTPDLDKEATLYSRLPELAKILRSIFVAEKKGVLPLEHVLAKLDNSFRTKLTGAELEEHVRKLCKLLPTWASIHNVRKTDYLKLAKDVDLIKVTKMLEIVANHKVKKS
ncbi:DNA replication factor Cdt1 isoform X1 [Polistes fuscatus]|uniref:DNA replication factor Cdt1 isoform X1 n=1 Tax=Polistes fuscatus TaxID=30207 RepID=UPI001CA80A52|nr:DNA replication factor Cdt1 isoform X1 [Polistes fuscatus]